MGAPPRRDRRPRSIRNRRQVRHSRAGPLTKAQIALRCQLGVGVHHDPPRNAELARQITCGRNPCARSQRTVSDRAPKLVLDLCSECPGAIAAHGEEQLYGLTGLVRRHDSGSSICTSENLASGHALDRVIRRRTTLLCHLDPRAAAARDAQHRAAGPCRAADRLLRRGRGGHRRLRDRARRRRSATRAARRPAGTDHGAAGQRRRRRRAARRDRRAAGRRPRSPSCFRSQPASGCPSRRSVRACEPSFQPFCRIPALCAPPTPSRRPSSS